MRIDLDSREVSESRCLKPDRLPAGSRTNLEYRMHAVNVQRRPRCA
jgi:hypothetical protein